MLQSRNPVLGRAGTEYRQEGYSATSGGPGQPPPPTAAQLAEMYHQPALVRPTTVMTINDVLIKSGLSFAVLLAGAVVGWVTAPMFIWVGGMIVGLVLGLVNAFKREVSPVLVVLYALAQGVFLGGISAFFQAFGEANGMGNLVLTAVVATFAVVGVMLFLFLSGVIKVTARFQRILMGAIIGYVVFSLVNLLAAWIFGMGGGARGLRDGLDRDPALGVRGRTGRVHLDHGLRDDQAVLRDGGSGTRVVADGFRPTGHDHLVVPGDSPLARDHRFRP